MSEENVELTLSLTDAFNRRDVEAAIALWDDEGVWYPAIEALTEGRSYTWRNGKCLEARTWSHAEALEAAGLSE